MARDTYDWEFREALEKDGWAITHESCTILTKEDGSPAATVLGYFPEYHRKHMDYALT